jgi:hypothetical protein
VAQTKTNRIIDFSRDKFSVLTLVKAMALDPIISVKIVLLTNKDWEKCYAVKAHSLIPWKLLECEITDLQVHSLKRLESSRMLAAIAGWDVAGACNA